jgi:hypothetical protein
MPAGGLSFDKIHWVHTPKKNDFFIHAKIISRKFRGKFLDFIKLAYRNGELNLKGSLACLGSVGKFSHFIHNLYAKEWVVNIQPPFAKPEKVLEYLSRYVFRVAISDRRISEVKDGKVNFSWKDYRTGLFRPMKLEIDEFYCTCFHRGFSKSVITGFFPAATANKTSKQHAPSWKKKRYFPGNRPSKTDAMCG